MQGGDRGCRNRNRFCSTVTSSTCPGPSAFADEEKYARIAPFAEIGRNDGSLNIGCSVDTSEEERIDVAEAVRKLRALERKRAAAMNRYLAELGYDA